MLVIPNGISGSQHAYGNLTDQRCGYRRDVQVYGVVEPACSPTRCETPCRWTIFLRFRGKNARKPRRVSSHEFRLAGRYIHPDSIYPLCYLLYISLGQQIRPEICPIHIHIQIQRPSICLVNRISSGCFARDVTFPAYQMLSSYNVDTRHSSWLVKSPPPITSI